MFGPRIIIVKMQTKMSKLIPVILLIILVVFGIFILKNKTNVIRYNTTEYEVVTIGKDSLVIFSYGTDIEVIKLSN